MVSARTSDLNGQIVLIVGGSSGIGFGIAKELLLSHSLNTIVIASSKQLKVDAAVERLSSLGRSSTKVVGDVVDAYEPKTIRDLMARVGEVDHIVWTSGGPLRLDFATQDLDSEKVRHAFDCHFWGPVIAAQAAKFKEGGSITLTTGIQAFTIKNTYIEALFVAQVLG